MSAKIKQTDDIGIGKSHEVAGRLPDFLIIGGMKCGSTTLYEYLCRHPGIFMCKPKEPMFFSREPVWQKGESWYRALFAAAAEEAICGEASTCYTRWPHYQNVPQRLSEMIPHAKLIYIMRHPVDRMYSHFTYTLRQHLELKQDFHLSFEQAIEASSEYLDASMYIRQIERYLPHFPREHFHFMILDDLNMNPDSELRKVQQFLHVNELDLCSDGLISANVGDGQRFALRCMELSVLAWRNKSRVASIVDLFPKSWRRRGKAILRQSLTASFLRRRRVEQIRQKMIPMRSETRMRLLQQLQQPTRELEEFLNRPLPVNWFL